MARPFARLRPGSSRRAARLGAWWDAKPLRRLRRNPLAWFGSALVVFFALVALGAPLLAPPTGNCARDLGTEAPTWRAVLWPPESCYQMTRFDLVPEPSPPRREAPLGSVQGYDIRYGLVWGTRTALVFGLVVVAVNILTGVAVGLAAGFFGGALDNLLMRFTDVVLAFPGLVLTLVIVAILGQGLFNVGLAFAMVGWPLYARVVRAEVLRVRRLEYVEAAHALGASGGRMMLRHILPNAWTPLLVLAVLDLGTIPLSVGALSFLGLGTAPGFADWGQLIGLAQGWVQGPPDRPFAYWYVSVFPGLAIVLYSLGWNLLGDALQEAVGR